MENFGNWRRRNKLLKQVQQDNASKKQSEFYFLNENINQDQSPGEAQDSRWQETGDPCL